MINSTVENNKLEEEIINLRNENQILKEQLKQYHISSETIHNNNTTNCTNNITESEKDKLRKQQLRKIFEFDEAKYNLEYGYSNMSEEDIAKGYIEMGNIIEQENSLFN